MSSRSGCSACRATRSPVPSSDAPPLHPPHHYLSRRTRMAGKAYLVGVGMTKFEKPETREWQYWDMAKEAGGKALADAGIGYEAVEQVPVGYCYQPSTAGQRAVYELGLTGIPVYNVNNNCAT